MKRHRGGTSGRYGAQFWTAFLANGLLLLFGVFMLAGATSATWSGSALFGIVLGVALVTFSVSIMVLVLRPRWHRIDVVGNRVRFPVGFRTIKIPVSEVAGVGLVFRFVPVGYRLSPGWDVTVWRTDGTIVSNPAARFVPFPRATIVSVGRPRIVDEAFVRRFVGNVDVRRLASSYPGGTATSIYNAVLQIQGPTGPLTTQHLQDQVTWANADTPPLRIAYWSPESGLGSAAWAPDREHSENPPVGWAN